jgi:tight adherence protein B
MSPLIISLAAFFGVVALVIGLAMALRDRSGNNLEDRLELLAGLKQPPSREDNILRQGALAALNSTSGMFDRLWSRFGDAGRLFEQADTQLTPNRFLAVSGILGLAGGVLGYALTRSAGAVPIAAILLAMLPLGWLLMRRRKRLKKFQAQLPDAMELIARALRAGHSLAAGLNLVAEEMPDPIGKEFGRCFEEQNLGIPLDDALRSLTKRVPNLDLKFFATAVILQRQTGGDLAEILDKIGYLIRERFKIWGQVQALTGEGRLSGIVLLALPPFLFLAVYKLNPTYCMVLFEDPLGKQMLAFAIVMQLIGALVIRKIVNIKV